MKPARLIGILFMVSVLAGMIGVVGLMLGGAAHGMHMLTHEMDDMVDASIAGLGHTDLKSPYKSVSIAGPIDLEWVRDTKPGFDLSGSPELVKRFEYKETGGEVKFKLKSGMSFGGHIKVVLHGPQPISLNIAGSGDSILHGLKNGELNISISGSGNADLAGTIDKLNATVAGSGDVKAFGLACERAEVSIAGSGDVNVNPLTDLNVSIVGSGDVRYHGNPSVEKSIVGSGSIEKKD